LPGFGTEFNTLNLPSNPAMKTTTDDEAPLSSLTENNSFLSLLAARNDALGLFKVYSAIGFPDLVSIPKISIPGFPSRV
jgi:hypothetical protein